MKITLITILILIFGTMIFAQKNAILLADGTADKPKKYDLITVETLEQEEVGVVKKVAFEREIEFSDDGKATFLETSNDRSIFELLDVEDGFFISREHKSRAYLYSRWSGQRKRSHQGILILDISNNGTKFTTKAHYVYDFRGDKFIRNIADMNNNFLSELAIFSEPPTAKYKKKLSESSNFRRMASKNSALSKHFRGVKINKKRRKV